VRLSGCLGPLLYLFVVATATADAFQEAQRQFESGDHGQALESIESVLATDAGNPEARFLKGLILVQQGEDNKAIKVFSQLTADYPGLPEPYNNLAVIYASQGEYEKARDALRAALKTHPSYTTAYANLGDIYAKMASQAYQQALELDKQDSRKLKVKLSLIDKLFPGKPASGVPEPGAQPAISTEPIAIRRAPVAKPLEQVESSSNDQMIIGVLHSWAAAWSSQDVGTYLSFYDAGFKPVSGTSSEWRKLRYQRLKKPAYIKVKLSEVKVEENTGRTAEVIIRQIYESDTFTDVTRKRIKLNKRSDGWKILSETVI